MCTKPIKVVYVAGPYRAKSGAHDASVYNEIEENIRRAEAAAIRLWDAGFGVLCPHLNTAHFEVKCPSVGTEAYLETDLQLLESCDILYLLPGWHKSSGSIGEEHRMKELERPIYTNIEHLIEMEGSDENL